MCKSDVFFNKDVIVFMLAVTFMRILQQIKCKCAVKNKNIIMGLFWDLIQQSEINNQGEKAANLEQRVAKLENELSDTKKLLRKTLLTLEKHLGKDIDGDGKLG